LSAQKWAVRPLKVAVCVELIQSRAPPQFGPPDEKNDGDNGNKLFPNLQGAGSYKFFGDEQEAMSYEHRGDGRRLAEKIALYTLLGVLIVGVIVLAAYGEQQANTVTTTCTSNANSATCKSSPGL
jgi:hypothetical protein